ncbi:hypothetical protein ACLKA7_017352 [Drosophila subpalustris]
MKWPKGQRDLARVSTCACTTVHHCLSACPAACPTVLAYQVFKGFTKQSPHADEDEEKRERERALGGKEEEEKMKKKLERDEFGNGNRTQQKQQKMMRNLSVRQAEALSR